MRRYISLIILTLFLLAAVPATYYLVQNRQLFFKKAAPTATLALTPASGSHAVGDIFDVQIAMDTGGNLAFMSQTSISYNPSLLDVVDASGNPATSIIPGTVFPSQYVATNTVNASSGTIMLAVGSTAGFSGSGTVGTIKFKVKAAGTAEVKFNPAPDTLIGGANGESLAGTLSDASYTLAGGGAALDCTGVTISPAGNNVTLGATKTLTAAATGGTGTITYTWGVTSPGSNKGNLTPTTGATVTWTAPANLNSAQTWTITATAHDDTTTDSTGCMVNLTYTPVISTPTNTPTNIPSSTPTDTPTNTPTNTPPVSSAPGPQTYQHKTCQANSCVTVDCSPKDHYCADSCTSDSGCTGGTGGSVSVTITSIAQGAVLTNARPTVAGKASPGASVQVTLYPAPTQSGTITADGVGNWSWVPNAALANGAHSATVIATDGTGNRTQAQIDFTIRTTTASTGGTGETTGKVTPPETASYTPTVVMAVLGFALLGLGLVLAL